MTPQRIPTHLRLTAGALAIVGAAAALSACASSDDTPDAPETVEVTETVGDPTTSTEPVDVSTETESSVEVDADIVDRPSPLAGGAPEVVATEIATTTQPIGFALRPGDDRLFVIDQDGGIMALDTETRAVEEVADLRSFTAARGEQGLLGLAFSPDGDRAYVNHTDLDGDTVIAEYRVESDGRLDTGSRRVLLEVDQPFGNHNGGRVVIGPDALLYIGMGDGGSAGDPLRLATDLSSLHGALLRIDPTPTADDPYQIPADNPYLDIEGARPELFAIGLRNPWGFGFDEVTGDLWVADVGQNEYEELNLVRAGADGTVAGAGVHFGWSAFEGFSDFNDDVIVTDHHRPVLVYEHGERGCSITGGDVYRNGSITELESAYVFSDFCSGRLWAFDVDADIEVELLQLDRVAAVSRGPDDEIWVASHNGTIWRIDRPATQ